MSDEENHFGFASDLPGTESENLRLMLLNPGLLPWGLLVGQVPKAWAVILCAAAVLTLVAGVVFILGMQSWGQGRLAGPTAITTVVSGLAGAFSGVYWQLDEVWGCFNEDLSRVDAIYFSVATFTTTGFGDVRPLTATCRLAVTLQMILGAVMILVVLGLWLANRGRPHSGETHAD